ncbi:MAG: restriction endonuclease subunit S [Planctomycetes bacterium]|nr:restriction endonuclease subunit S [Planctomycetota bacterium]
MISSYKRLEPYIQEIVCKNSDLKVNLLLGVSVTKEFIPSIANTVGTDMSKYKIVSKDQFAYGPVTSRNSDKISVALLTEDECICSTSYTVFEIKDHEALLPEYLMMWFRRPEFDRYARYMSHGSVRELFGWEELCNIELPIPSPEKQREIINEYNTIVDRIKLNENLNQKLEETAQAIYKQWFVDFEFPISAEYAKSIGKPELEGKPYKSSGGRMSYDEANDSELPKDWNHSDIGRYTTEMKSGGTPNRSVQDYWNKAEYPWLKTGEVANCVIINSEEYISQDGLDNSSAKLLPANTVLIAMYGDGKTKGQVGYLKFSSCTNQACCAMICEDEVYSSYLYYYLRSCRDTIVQHANGGAQENLSKDLISNLPILRPHISILQQHPFLKLLSYSEATVRSSESLYALKNIVLAKMSRVS